MRVVTLTIATAVLMPWSLMRVPTALGASSDSKAVWGGVLSAIAWDSPILPLSVLRDGEFSSVLWSSPHEDNTSQGISALMNLESVVALALLTFADGREQEFRVPLSSGDVAEVFSKEIILGGTVVVFSPLTGSVLATSPILGARWLRLPQRPSAERLRAETLQALQAFVRLVRERGRIIQSRTRSTSVRVPVLGMPILEAGQSDGVRVGTAIDVVDSRAKRATQCLAAKVEDENAEMDCPESVTNGSKGTFVRAAGVGVERYQVRSASISSARARETLGTTVVADQSTIAFAASDTLAAHGLTVLPPADATGQRLVDHAVQEFMASHAIAQGEFEKLVLKFPPAEIQIDIVVDGYNSQMVREGTVKRVRAHKAWAKATDSLGRSADGVGVELVEEVTDWERDIALTADAMQAITAAVKCATDRLIGKESQQCTPE